VLTGTFYGDTGCPVRPLPSPAIDTDIPFSALGTGFAPGTLSLYLDSATGTSLGSASVAADGTFCDAAFNGPPVSQLGNHTLVAIQEGTVKLKTPVQVFQPEVIH
jgi:hypothetical protein